MESGRMDRVIIIQENVGQKSSSGQVLGDWQNISDNPKVWASVQRDKGREGYESDQKSASDPKVFKVHYRNDLKESHTIVFEGRRYDITSFQEIPRRRGLLIYALWRQGQYEDEA